MMSIGETSATVEKEAEAPPIRFRLLPQFHLIEEGHPIAMNMNVVKGFRLTEISRWAKQYL